MAHDYMFNCPSDYVSVVTCQVIKCQVIKCPYTPETSLRETNANRTRGLAHRRVQTDTELTFLYSLGIAMLPSGEQQETYCHPTENALQEWTIGSKLAESVIGSLPKSNRVATK